MKRKPIAAATAALAVVALSACGSSTEAKPAAESTVDGQAVATKMVDAMVASKTAHVTMATKGKQIGEGDLELTDPGKVAMKVSSGETNISVVQVEGVIYIKGLPGMTKPWLKVDPKGTLGKAMSTLGDLSKQSNPRVMVSMMEGVKGKVVGTEQVGGVSTQHYAFVIPISAYGKAFGPELPKQAGITKPLDVDFWVGDDNLPRKVNVVIDAAVKTQTSVTYSNWGKPVSIVAPPAAELGTIPGM